jgi:hypothetical protein
VVSSGPTPSQGSLQLTTTGTGSHWSVFNEDHGGTPLTAITALSYSTYSNDPGDTEDPGLQLVIDPGNTTGIDAGVTYSTLNFEPYLQPGGQTYDTWQTWNVMTGVVWGTHLTGATEDAPISWSTFLSDYPNATILSEAAGGGVGVNVGSGWTAMVGDVGALTFGTSAGTTTYTFDPTVPSTSTTTTPTNSSIVLGSNDTDGATVTGNAIIGGPTGTVSFYECGPISVATPCTSKANPVGSPVNLTAGPGDTSTATSASFTPTALGYWCFAGYYSGDSNYSASSDATVDECVNVGGHLTVTTTSLPSGTKGVAYSTAVTALGGTAPYKWSHTGRLPMGIKLNRTTGALSGTPKVSGSFTFVVKVKDSSRHPRETATQSVTLVISP